MSTRKQHPIFRNITVSENWDIFVNDKLVDNDKEYISFRDSKSDGGDDGYKERKEWVIVYECFNGVNQLGKIVKHRDGDKSNNSIANLYLTDKSFKMKRTVPHSVIAIHLSSGDETPYKSIYACCNELGIIRGAIRQVLIGKLSKAKAKSNNQYYTFRIDENK